MIKDLHTRVSAIFTAIMAGASAWAWNRIPADASLPVHWGFDLQPDRYGGKAEGLLLLPAVGLVVTVALALAPRFAPRRRNLLRSGKAYGAIRVALLAFLTLVHGAVLLEATGTAMSMSVVMPLGLGLLFVVMGNVMGKLRSNYFVGARTPWTLSSELSWNKTNRLAGRSFVLIGLAMLAIGLAGGSTHLVSGLLFALLGVLALVFVYSWAVWRRDPARREL